MSWRPEGWKHITRKLLSEILSKHPAKTIDVETFEVGADAMLEALKEMGNSGVVTYFPGTCEEEGTGDYVFVDSIKETSQVQRLEDLVPEGIYGTVIFIPDNPRVRC